MSFRGQHVAVDASAEFLMLFKLTTIVCLFVAKVCKFPIGSGEFYNSILEPLLKLVGLEILSFDRLVSLLAIQVAGSLIPDVSGEVEDDRGPFCVVNCRRMVHKLCI